MKKIFYYVLFLMAVTASMGAYAEERLDLEGATIVGNRELPKVLYVVPWKLPNQGHIVSRSMTRQISEDLAPINQTNFHRFLELHTLRQGKNP